MSTDGAELRLKIAWMIAGSDEFARNGLSTEECLPLADRILAAAGALAPAVTAERPSPKERARLRRTAIEAYHRSFTDRGDGSHAGAMSDAADAVIDALVGRAEEETR